jgi:hypothetical protein
VAKEIGKGMSQTNAHGDRIHRVHQLYNAMSTDEMPRSCALVAVPRPCNDAYRCALQQTKAHAFDEYVKAWAMPLQEREENSKLFWSGFWTCILLPDVVGKSLVVLNGQDREATLFTKQAVLPISEYALDNQEETIKLLKNDDIVVSVRSPKPRILITLN